MNTHNTSYNITSFYPGVFDEIKALLFFALRELGYKVYISDRTIYTDATNILFGVHTLGEKVKNLPDNVIIFNLEQLNLNHSHNMFRAWTHLYLELGHRFEIWDYNAKNITFWQSNGIQAKLFEFGYQKELNRIYSQAIKKNEKITQDIDVLFYGSLNERRRYILEGMMARGIKVKHLLNIYGQERDEWIARSKLVLNLHAHNTEIFEIVRCSYLMNNAVPIVSEINPTTIIEPRFLDCVAGVPYEQLIDKCEELILDDKQRLSLGYRGLNILSQQPQFQLLQKIL